MKILMINSYYAPNFHGGADISVQHLAKGLQQAGHDIVILTLAKELYDSTHSVNGVTVHYLGVNNRMSHIRNKDQSAIHKAIWQLWSAANIAMSRRLREIYLREKPNLVHTHILAGFSTKPWSVASKLSLPVVHTLHDYFLICPRGTMFRGNSMCCRQCSDCRLITQLRKRDAQDIAAVVGVSNYILQAHVAKGYFSGVPVCSVINNSIPDVVPTAAPKLPQGPLRLGFLGRLEPFKGLDLLLDAVSRISTEKVTLNIAGVGVDKYVQHLKTTWSLPNVEYFGLVDPESFLPEIDVLVVPSNYHDPAPRVVLEALAYGIPVLGNSYGGMSELIEEGKSGWIWDLSQPDALFKSIEKLVDERENYQGRHQQCLQRAATFTREIMVNKHLDLYENILAKQGATM